MANKKPPFKEEYKAYVDMVKEFYPELKGNKKQINAKAGKLFEEDINKSINAKAGKLFEEDINKSIKNKYKDIHLKNYMTMAPKTSLKTGGSLNKGFSGKGTGAAITGFYKL